MSEARTILNTVADATGTVRSTLDALEQLLSVMHDDDAISLLEAQEVDAFGQRLVAEAYAASKKARGVLLRALMEREDAA